MPITFQKTGKVVLQPKYYKPAYLIQITRKDGTVDTVADSSNPSTSALNYVMVQLAKNEIASQFTLQITNENGQFTGLWTGNEAINIWADFGNASTKIFRGRIEAPRYQFNINVGRIILLNGRCGMGELQDKTCVGNFQNADSSSINSSIISQAAAKGCLVTYSASSVGFTITDITFKDSYCHTALLENNKRAGCEFRVDENYALQVWLKGSLVNNTESVTHGVNMLDLDLGTDTRKVKNFIRAYGSSFDNSLDIPIIKTAQDDASISDNGWKDYVINNSSIESYDSGQQAANAELAARKNNVAQGTVTALGMPTLKPGQKFRISDPYSNVNGFYTAAEVFHSISVDGGFTTRVTVEVLPFSIDKITSDLNNQTKATSTFINNNGMTESFQISFKESTPAVTLSNCTITDGKLQITLGTQGSATSNVFTARMNCSQGELRIAGEDLGNSTFDCSNDGGNSWLFNVALSTLLTFSSSSNSFVVKINLNSDATNVNPTVDTVGIYGKP